VKIPLFEPQLKELPVDESAFFHQTQHTLYEILAILKEPTLSVRLVQELLETSHCIALVVLINANIKKETKQNKTVLILFL
jgi:hypothetical protein